MIEARCHCGRVRLHLRFVPTELTDCNCSLCRRYGALWAYYPKTDVQVEQREPGVDAYSWGSQTRSFYRCSTCGCVTHWEANDPARSKLGVNARLLEADIVAGVPIRPFDGAATSEYL